jgi:tetratricopeptide (TPR) repeat protein
MTEPGDRKPGDPDPFEGIQHAEELAGSRHYDEALGELEAMLRNGPWAARDEARILRAAGRVAESARRPQLAVEYYEKSAEVQRIGGVRKGIASVHMALSRLYEKMGMNDRAQASLKRCAELAEQSEDKRMLSLLRWLKESGGLGA